MINLHIDELEKRYGKSIKLKNAIGICPMDFIKTPHGDLFYSYVFFDVIPLERYNPIFDDFQNCKMPKFLKEIYSITNGCRMFCDSLVVYGEVSDYTRGELYSPFGYFLGCLNGFQQFRDAYKRKNKKEYPVKLYKDSEYRIFGWAAGSYLSFKPGDEKVYALTDGSTGESIKTYNSFQECWDHYFYGFMDRFDDDGRNKKPFEKLINYLWYGHQVDRDF